MIDLIILQRTFRALQLSSGKLARDSTLPLVPQDYERLMGFGIAADWIGWAHGLKELTYSERRRRNSDRAPSVNEATRFTFMWTAANALFVRPSITSTIAVPNGTSELERFRVLYQKTALSAQEETSCLKTLHTLLGVHMHVKHFPWPVVGTHPTILEVIYHKHTVADQQKTGFGKKMLQAITTNNYSKLDLPTLIYATRNWTVHGVLLSSSFRGTRKKFELWIDTSNHALARTLEGSSSFLLSSLCATMPNRSLNPTVPPSV